MIEDKAFDRWAPTRENARAAMTGLGGYVLAVAVLAVVVKVANPDKNVGDGFSFVVLLGVVAAVGWIVLGLLFNLWALFVSRADRRGF